MCRGWFVISCPYTEFKTVRDFSVIVCGKMGSPSNTCARCFESSIYLRIWRRWWYGRNHIPVRSCMKTFSSSVRNTTGRLCWQILFLSLASVFSFEYLAMTSRVIPERDTFVGAFPIWWSRCLEIYMLDASIMFPMSNPKIALCFPDFYLSGFSMWWVSWLYLSRLASTARSRAR